MNKKLDEFKKNIKGKKIAILGMGISNIPATNYLISLGADVTAFDKKGNENLDKLNIKKVIGENYLDNLNDFDYILRSPGINPKYIKTNNNNCVITSEIELLITILN